MSNLINDPFTRPPALSTRSSTTELFSSPALRDSATSTAVSCYYPADDSVTCYDTGIWTAVSATVLSIGNVSTIFIIFTNVDSVDNTTDNFYVSIDRCIYEDGVCFFVNISVNFVFNMAGGIVFSFGFDERLQLLATTVPRSSIRGQCYLAYILYQVRYLS